jgi:hypothetical protein
MCAATCALELPTYAVRWLHTIAPEPTAESAQLTAWLHECAGARTVAYFDDRAANFAHAIRRVVELRLPMPFRATRGSAGCCRETPPLVQLVDLERDLGEQQYQVVPVIFRAVEPLLCLPDVWGHCWRRGTAETRRYFAVAHAAATACLYVHVLLQREQLDPTQADAATAAILEQLAQQPTANLGLDISDLPEPASP